MKTAPSLDELVEMVRAGAKYQAIHPDLVRRVTEQELSKGRGLKDTVKAARSKLHQMGGAYMDTSIDYAQWKKELRDLPADLSAQAVREACLRWMRSHASTRERLPFLEDFFRQTLGPLGPLRSVYDYACGLNPLCLPWLPLAPGAAYHACDIYADQIGFLNEFFAHFRLSGSANLCDLTAAVPDTPVQVGLLLKTIPCLEQFDKTAGARLLAAIPAEHLLVSFPARSLGGRSKGMVDNYEAHFEDLIAGQNWRVQRYEFPTELAFLISR